MITQLINDLKSLDVTQGWGQKLFLHYQKHLCTVLPNTLPWRMESYFRDTLFFQRLAHLQQSQAPYALGVLPADFLQTPSVVLTAHLYSYRTVVRYLAESGLRIALLVSSRVYLEQKQIFEAIIAPLADSPLQERFLLLDAECPHVLFRAKRAFDRGFHIVAYIDGNTGAGHRGRVGDNLLPVRFGQAQLQVRQGVILLAQWLQCGIYTLWPQLDDSYQSYFRLQAYDIDRASSDMIQDIYTDLYEIIRVYPAQWECFLYLQDLQ